MWNACSIGFLFLFSWSFSHILASDLYFEEHVDRLMLLFHLIEPCASSIESSIKVETKRCLCRRFHPNYTTQTPSGTLDNTALALIQVLNLHRGLAVNKLNSVVSSVAFFLKRLNDSQNLQQSVTLRVCFAFKLTGAFFLFLTSAVSSWPPRPLDIFTTLWMSNFSPQSRRVNVNTPFSCVKCHGFLCSTRSIGYLFGDKAPM